MHPQEYTAIKAKKDLYNKGKCFTKGKVYQLSNSVCALPGLMERDVINDLGEHHTIGSWWREFELVVTKPLTYLYIIDIDERGSFKARVEHPDTQADIFTLLAGDELPEDETNAIIDGYMKNKYDVDGLQSYLIEIGLIKPTDTIRSHKAHRKNRYQLPGRTPHQ